MRALLFVSVLALSAPARAAIPSTELFTSCEVLERELARAGDDAVPVEPWGRQCRNYLEAVSDIKDSGYTGVCLQPGTRLVEIVRAFTKYARANPDKLDLHQPPWPGLLSSKRFHAATEAHWSNTRSLVMLGVVADRIGH
jgi:hypothetical protein